PLDWVPAIGLVSGFAGMLVIRRAEALNRSNQSPATMLWAGLVLGGVTVLAQVAGMLLVVGPTEHANGALRFVLLTYCAVHAGVATLLALHAQLRWRGGFVSAIRATDMGITRAWTDYAALA